MNLAEEDWLTDEKFDFDLNLSKSSIDGLSNVVEDEEVFLDTAKITLKENEPYIHIHDEKGFHDKESGIIASKIKNTPGLRSTTKSTKSPVAIVHPMMRDDIINRKENIEKICPENKENIPNEPSKKNGNLNLTLGSSNLTTDSSSVIHSNKAASASKNKKLKRLSLPPKTSSNPIGLVGPFSKHNTAEKKKDVKIDAPPSVSKIKQSNFKKLTKLSSSNSEFMEQSSGIKNQNSVALNSSIQSRLKKPLMIPKPGLISKSKSGGGIPSITSSAPRIKQDSVAIGLKPLKTASQSLSGISQVQEKSKISNLKLSARKCISVGTPESHKKLSKSSVVKRQSVTKKIPNSSVDTPLTEKRMLKPPRSITKQSSLITPSMKPPRKSIVGRKLISKSDDESPKNDKPGNELNIKTSELSKENEVFIDKANDITIDCRMNEDGYEVISLSPTVMNDLEESNENLPIECGGKTLSENIVPEIVLSQLNDTTSELPEVKESDDTDSCTTGNVELAKELETVLFNSDIDDTGGNAENKKEEEIDLLGLNSVELDAVPALLLEISNIDSEISPLKVNAMDPFKTGHTPPPLIQLDIILEPEKPPELNLIEFF